MRIEYDPEQFKQTVVEYESQGYELVAVEDITDGNFLTFRRKEISAEERIQAVEEALLTLMFREGVEGV